jgi:hypothetical protein
VLADFNSSEIWPNTDEPAKSDSNLVLNVARSDASPIWPEVAWIGWSYNPEVAGSNPAPGSEKRPWKQGLFSAGSERDLNFCKRLCKNRKESGAH